MRRNNYDRYMDDNTYTDSYMEGQFLMFRSMSKSEMIARVREIIDKSEADGAEKLNQIPEGEEKDELRGLLEALGFGVYF